MNDQTVRETLDAFLQAWENSSLIELESFISTNYQAREVRDGDIAEFGYEGSIEGWKQGFEYVKGSQGEWEIHEVGVIPMKDHEFMAVLYATIKINGKPMETGNLFFDTFKKVEDGWKLVRSYIETGVKGDLVGGALRGTDLKIGLGEMNR
ncbi:MULTISPECIES: nuclear transport factor 2 family protein [Bacillaceae]|uniref:nuclear transport factor 2 family protein n=1 Tax=Bacillaceae TaxID=186817 RepID=UPI001C55D575|nr:nuclear transport factor 2 family protein [Rossellomorea sp. YZS02]MBW3112586.1 nuclear transport factor 2 family protein [Bacillus sp. MCCB 382]MDX8344586.1 nuclear transport factor 2 family protein [Rossellomorea sp. YZS02]